MESGGDWMWGMDCRGLTSLVLPASGLLIASCDDVRARWRRHLNRSARRDDSALNHVTVFVVRRLCAAAEEQRLNDFRLNERDELPDGVRTLLSSAVTRRNVPRTDGQKVIQTKRTALVTMTITKCHRATVLI